MEIYTAVTDGCFTQPSAAMTERHYSRWIADGLEELAARVWLQEYEDNDPAKNEQYARWREMRSRGNTGSRH